MGLHPKHVVMLVVDSLPSNIINTEKDLPFLFANATRFTNAWSAGCWTLPATASVLTGMMPHEHGAETRTRSGLRGDIPTLAELLRDNGFATYQVTANAATTTPFGLDRGFDRVIKAWELIVERHMSYEVLLSILGKRRLRQRAWHFGRDYILGKLSEDVTSSRVWFTNTAEIVCTEASRIVDEHRRRDSQSFVFMNLMEAHFPYRWGAPLATTSDSLREAFREYRALYQLVNQTWLAKGEMTIAPDMLARIRLRQCKAWKRLAPIVNTFVEKMAQHDDTVVIFMSDHGDCFGEDNTAYHFGNVTDNGNHVPLCIADGARLETEEITTPVSSRDVFGTILDLAGIGHNHVNILNTPERSTPFLQAQWYDLHGKTHAHYRHDLSGFVDDHGKPWMFRNGVWHRASSKGGRWIPEVRGVSPIEELPMSRERRRAIQMAFDTHGKFRIANT